MIFFLERVLNLASTMLTPIETSKKRYIFEKKLQNFQNFWKQNAKNSSFLKELHFSKSSASLLCSF